MALSDTEWIPQDGSLGAFSLLCRMVWFGGQVVHVFRKVLDQIVDYIGRQQHVCRPSVIVNHWNSSIAASSHQLDCLANGVNLGKRDWLRSHMLLHRGVKIRARSHQFQHVTLGENPNQLVVFADEDISRTVQLHLLDGGPNSGRRLDTNWGESGNPTNRFRLKIEMKSQLYARFVPCAGSVTRG